MVTFLPVFDVLWLFVLIFVVLLLQDCFYPMLFLVLDFEVARLGPLRISMDSSMPDELLSSWAPDEEIV